MPQPIHSKQTPRQIQHWLSSLIVSILLTASCRAMQSFGPCEAFTENGDTPMVGIKGFDYVNPDAPKGGRIRLSAFGSFNTLNPFTLGGVAADGISSTFESLGLRAFDEANTVYGLVAQSFEYRRDKQQFIVKIHQQATFHDQSPIHATDIIATFNTLKSHGHPMYQQLLADIESVHAPTPHTVIFTTSKTPSKDLPFNIAGLPVLSKKDLEGRTFSKTTMKPLLGSGPYQVSQFKLGNYVEYRKNKQLIYEALKLNLQLL